MSYFNTSKPTAIDPKGFSVFKNEYVIPEEKYYLEKIESEEQYQNGDYEERVISSIKEERRLMVTRKEQAKICLDKFISDTHKNIAHKMKPIKRIFIIIGVIILGIAIGTLVITSITSILLPIFPIFIAISLEAVLALSILLIYTIFKIDYALQKRKLKRQIDEIPAIIKKLIYAEENYKKSEEVRQYIKAYKRPRIDIPYDLRTLWRCEWFDNLAYEGMIIYRLRYPYEQSEQRLEMYQKEYKMFKTLANSSFTEDIAKGIAENIVQNINKCDRRNTREHIYLKWQYTVEETQISSYSENIIDNFYYSFSMNRVQFLSNAEYRKCLANILSIASFAILSNEITEKYIYYTDPSGARGTLSFEINDSTITIVYSSPNGYYIAPRNW